LSKRDRVGVTINQEIIKSSFSLQSARPESPISDKSRAKESQLPALGRGVFPGQRRNPASHPRAYSRQRPHHPELRPPNRGHFGGAPFSRHSFSLVCANYRLIKGHCGPSSHYSSFGEHAIGADVTATATENRRDFLIFFNFFALDGFRCLYRNDGNRRTASRARDEPGEV
jgi:hypothetical protein